MRSTILHVAFGFVMLTVASRIASAQNINPGTYNETIAAGSGTLSYTVTVSQPIGCGTLRWYYSSYYQDFSYTVGGITYPLSGTTTADHGPPSSPSCPTNAPPVTFWAPTAEIVFTPSYGNAGSVCNQICVDGSALTTALTPGILYPKWQVQSIIYDTPGNKSSNGFQDALTDGTTTSTGKSFTQGNTTTFSLSFGFLFGSSTLSWSYGSAATTGNSTAVTSTISDATGVLNASAGTGTPNTINHQQDLFIIWLNPAVELFQTGLTSETYALGTQLQTTGDPDPGQPEIQDQVEVFAQAMMPNSGNGSLTNVPVNILKPQIVDGQTLPGLANICANPAYYPDSCTQANQCGCVPSDFAGILMQDPLLSYSSTESPLNANTDSAALCTNAAPTAKCRFIPIMTSDGSSVQQTQLLSGPDVQGGNNPPNTFSQTDSTTTTQTLSESQSSTVGFSWKQMWGTATDGVGLQSQETWTWTYSESNGKINGTAHTMSVTFSSSTVGCYQHIPIFEDTVFHTFVFTQPVGDASCP